MFDLATTVEWLVFFDYSIRDHLLKKRKKNMSLLFQGFVQFFVWIILRYFDVLINICEVSDLFHIVFEISVKDQNFSLTLLCTYVSTDTPIFVLDLEQSSSSIYKKNFHF